MTKDVVVHNGFPGIATETFVCIVRHSEKGSARIHCAVLIPSLDAKRSPIPSLCMGYPFELRYAAGGLIRWIHDRPARLVAIHLVAVEASVARWLLASLTASWLRVCEAL